MATAAEFWIATFVVVVVSASLPFFLYGAWIVLREDVVTWAVLIRHLTVIAAGLALTTAPILLWMLPRLLEQLDSFTILHAFLGFQAYALLLFALTGIVRIFQVKRRHDLYHEPDPEIELSELHEDMDAWRFRLRVGVFGYLGFWLLAWLVGLARYVVIYDPV
ncbi:MAG: hypothetical protein ABEH59_02700 [Halobacteriales archaeon]